MKIKSHKSHKKIIIALLVTMLMLVGAGAIYALNIFDNSSPNEKSQLSDPHRPVGETDYSPPTPQQEKAGVNTPSQPPATNTPGQPSGSIPVAITYAEGSPLQIRILISEILSSGTCTLTLERPGHQKITRQADTFPSAASSTCMGFDMDTSSLAKGVWQATVKVTSGPRMGVASKEVTL